MTKFLICCFCFTFLLSCQTKKCEQNPQKAKEFFSDGMKITSDRVLIQSKDSIKAMELNKKAIEKFSAAYAADTTYINAALFASECTMFAKDYQNCIYWTSTLLQLDTAASNLEFCKNRIDYCNKQMQLR